MSRPQGCGPIHPWASIRHYWYYVRRKAKVGWRRRRMSPLSAPSGRRNQLGAFSAPRRERFPAENASYEIQQANQKTIVMSNDNRSAQRTRCLREGHCVFNKGYSSLDVTVRNISATGARLSGNELICLPEEFELQIHDGFGAFASHRVKRVWSRADFIGVAFIDSVHGRSADCEPAQPRTAVLARPLGRAG